MAITVEVEGISQPLEFPDGTSPDVIQSTVKKVIEANRVATAQYADPTEEMNAAEAFLVSAGKGFNDVLQGLKRAAATASGDEATAEAFKQEALNEERTFAPVKEAFPVASFAGEVVGESGALPVGGVGGNMITRGATAVAAGGAASAIGEAGRGGGTSDIIKTGATGAVAAPVGEVVGDVLGRAVGRVTPDMPSSTTARRADAAAEGIDLTAGQAAQDPVMLARERALTASDSPAGEMARVKMDQQAAQVERMRERIVGEAADAGESIKASLAERRALERSHINKLYDELESAAARLPDGADNLSKNFQDRIDVDALLREFEPTPGTQKLIQNAMEDFGMAAADKQSKLYQGPLSLKNAERLRQRLNRVSPTEPRDIEFIRQVREGLDDAVTKTVEESGDDSIKQAAEAARSAVVENRRIFKNKDIVQRITQLKKNAVDAEEVPVEAVVDTIFTGGQGKVAANIKAVRRAMVEGGATDATREAYKALQADAMTRVLSPVIDANGRVNSRALERSIQKFGEDNLRQLLGDQYKTVQKFRKIVQDIDAPLTSLRPEKARQVQSAVADVLGAVAALKHGFIIRLAATNVAKAAEEVLENRRIRQETLQGILQGETPEQAINSFIALMSAAATRNAAVQGADPARDAINEEMNPQNPSP